MLRLAGLQVECGGHFGDGDVGPGGGAPRGVLHRRRKLPSHGAGEQIGVGLTVACVHVSCPA